VRFARADDNNCLRTHGFLNYVQLHAATDIKNCVQLLVTVTGLGTHSGRYVVGEGDCSIECKLQAIWVCYTSSWLQITKCLSCYHKTRERKGDAECTSREANICS
jgi:hypothetical protein